MTTRDEKREEMDRMGTELREEAVELGIADVDYYPWGITRAQELHPLGSKKPGNKI